MESSQFGTAESEFLFAPYSVFTVVSVEASARNSYLAPHVITPAPPSTTAVSQRTCPSPPGTDPPRPAPLPPRRAEARRRAAAAGGGRRSGPRLGGRDD